MADFRQKKRFRSKLPQLTVAAGLPPGRYVFQLEVEDESGNTSRPARVKVIVVPTVDPVGPRGGGIVGPLITRTPVVRTPRPR